LQQIPLFMFSLSRSETKKNNLHYSYVFTDWTFLYAILHEDMQYLYVRVRVSVQLACFMTNACQLTSASSTDVFFWGKQEDSRI